MLAAPIPKNESYRIKDLYDYDILDTENEKDFDDLVDIVSAICDCPIATITFVDKDRQWFKAEKNMPAKESGRDVSFCGHAIMHKEIMIVPDARKDDRFFDNPFVTSGIKIRFYAGAPIVSSSGYVLGTVCAIDNSPRNLTDLQKTALEKIARQVSRLLDLRIKNKQIIEVSEKLISAEKRMSQLNLQKQEAANFNTAYSLHEEIMQVIAAAKLYTSLAVDSTDLRNTYLASAKQELDHALKSLRTLSGAILPTTHMNDMYAAYIAALVKKHEQKTGVKATYVFDGPEEALKGERGLMVYRIIQDLFTLAVKAFDKSLHITITDKLVLHFSFEASVVAEDHSLLNNNISNRTALLEGNMEVEESIDADKKQYSYKITIPIS